MLTRWTDFDRAFSMMDDLQRRMSRLFDEYGAARWPTLSKPTAGTWPPVNLYDAGDELVLQAQVPGMSNKDIQITGHQETLMLRGERKVDLPDDHSVHRQERGSVEFSRSFALPCRVDMEKTSALVKDGVLTVRVAKAAEAKPRQIEVKTRG